MNVTYHKVVRVEGDRLVYLGRAVGGTEMAIMWVRPETQEDASIPLFVDGPNPTCFRRHGKVHTTVFLTPEMVDGTYKLLQPSIRSYSVWVEGRNGARWRRRNTGGRV